MHPLFSHLTTDERVWCLFRSYPQQSYGQVAPASAPPHYPQYQYPLPPPAASPQVTPPQPPAPSALPPAPKPAVAGNAAPWQKASAKVATAMAMSNFTKEQAPTPAKSFTIPKSGQKFRVGGAAAGKCLHCCRSCARLCEGVPKPSSNMCSNPGKNSSIASSHLERSSSLYGFTKASCGCDRAGWAQASRVCSSRTVEFPPGYARLRGAGVPFCKDS